MLRLDQLIADQAANAAGIDELSQLAQTNQASTVDSINDLSQLAQGNRTATQDQIANAMSDQAANIGRTDRYLNSNLNTVRDDVLASNQGLMATQTNTQ